MLPPALFQAPLGAWSSFEPMVRIGPRLIEGIDYAAFAATGGWNSVTAVQSAPASWDPEYAPKLAFTNFKDLELDFHTAGPVALDVLAIGAKHGSVTTGGGDDHVVWDAHSDMGGTSANTMVIATGAGDDTILVTSMGHSSFDAGLDAGDLRDGPYDGRFSFAAVTAGGGNDTITAQGLTSLRANGGAGTDLIHGAGGQDTIIGSRGDDLLSGGGEADSFVFRPGDGHDTIADFMPGVDRLAFHGISAAEVSTQAVVIDGNTGLLVTYGTAGDTVFLAGVLHLLASDLVF
ncbi:calcium-binding protein [Siccirubricoccus sp. G192]|uniref:calcium-binding protein n=1 Tax=Siccirubricoccus sp. G192 TaxID=2849651 RepID=UPI001C2C9068|nr:calcium-binding protein [Siccirubricoccus sp. G192]MBV1795887.1 hypothetical protein [Siccirubricoccus sp. G192]